MAIDSVLAGIAVNDFASALAWYERLLGRPADTAPMDGLAEWYLSECGGIRLIRDEDRAGSSSVTLVVTSLDDRLAVLKAGGTPGLVKVATVIDPKGNRYLGGLTPAEAVRVGRTDRAEAALEALDSGVFV